MEDGRGVFSDTESIVGEGLGSSGHLNSPLSDPLNTNPRSERKSARFNLSDNKIIHKNQFEDDDEYIEITFDVFDNSVAVHCVKPATGGSQIENPEVALLARTLERKPSIGSSFIISASSRIKQVSQELRRLTSLTKHQSIGTFDRSKSGAAPALKGLKFITKADGVSGWSAIEKMFEELAVNGSLPRAAFGQCIGMKDSKEFAGVLFDALTRKRNITRTSISKEELQEFWEEISDQSFDSRLQTFFDMFDKNADGRITEDEVKEIISLSASANGLSKIQEQAEEYAALIMEELDPDNIGYIEIHNLETLLLQAPNRHMTLGTSSSKNLSKLLSQKLKPTKESNPIRRWYKKTKYFLQDNWKRVWLISLWIAILSGLFTYKFLQYRRRAAYQVMGSCVCIAKGAAETLKFNMALILLPVCRNTITWLRNKTNLGVAVPFDDNLNFHKVIAVGIAIGIGFHAGAHLTCDFPRILHADEEKYELMKPFFGEEKPPNYWWFVKGVEGVTGIIMVALISIAFTLATPRFRRNKFSLPGPLKKITGFNAFWYSHHLFIIVYSLFIVHGIKLYLTKKWYKKTAWMYIAAPMFLYFCERMTRALRSRIKPVQIRKVAIYPGNVLELHMSKPQGFKYKSGQCMFVKCASVSPFEWHPFSITSSPSDDYLSVHIRTLGDWTRQLRTVFSEVCQASTAKKNGLLRPDCIQDVNSPSFPKVLIDGPYGAPAQDYKKYEVVLLVGLGIGATPFISIVKDIVNNLKRQKEEEEMLENGLKVRSGSKKKRGFRTTRAYFYWVTREQSSFEWFEGVMNEVAETDQKGAIELHNYCTSVYEEDDARSALIAMLQSLNHAKYGYDVVSGTRVKSHFAKPNWRNVYKTMAMNHPESRIGVFYCGAAGLTHELKQLALDFSRKTSTKFDFHKENF